MGGMDLSTVVEDLKTKLGDDLVIERRACLSQCQKGPNVLLNDVLMVGVTPERLKHEILAQHDREGEYKNGITGQ
jgi:NADH:ubiquinone oxidoreductase subunit E